MAPSSPTERSQRLAAGVLAAAALVLVAVAIAWVLWRPAAREPGAPTSIAVLPFQTISWSPDTTRLGDGLHEDLIGRLARLRNVRVISRTSVMAYRRADIAQVARELGVAYVVESSVQLTGSRLRVTARLVEASTGRGAWSNTYDRELADVFDVQADLAQRIAAGIGMDLTPDKAALLQRAPTRNLDAYQLYLRALEVDRQATPQKPALTAAVADLDRAVGMDPAFAEAHALLSRLQMTIYWVAGDYDKALLPVALRHAEAAQRLVPDLAQAQLALALYWYWGHRNYPKALAFLEGASEREPNNATAHYLSGTIRLRFGQWPEALASLGRAAELDPRNERILQAYAVALSEARRFADAEEVLVRLSAIAPRSAFAISLQVRNRLRWKGAAGAIEARLGEFTAQDDPYCLIPLARFDLAFLQEQYREAAAAILACTRPVVGMLHTVPAPTRQFSAMASAFAGDLDRARADSRAAQAHLEERLTQRPDLPLTRMALAYMLAIEGRRARALEQADRALNDMPPATDAVVAAELLDHAAALHAHLGEHDRALNELERALKLANGAYAPVVRRNPFWRSLRDDPRFRQLVGEEVASGS